MADPSENVILQGYAITGADASEQAIVTQGYAFTQIPPPSGGMCPDIVYLDVCHNGTRVSCSMVRV